MFHTSVVEQPCPSLSSLKHQSRRQNRENNHHDPVAEVSSTSGVTWAVVEEKNFVLEVDAVDEIEKDQT